MKEVLTVIGLSVFDKEQRTIKQDYVKNNELYIGILGWQP